MMRVHVLQVGRVSLHEGFFGATKLRTAFREAFANRGASFPVFAFVVEHPDGHIVIDTGWSHEIQSLPGLRLLSRVMRAPPLIEPGEDIGSRMRAAGLRPEDVRLVIPTHLDCDHAGGIGAFPDATIVVNRAEWDYVTKTRFGRARAQGRLWPAWFEPSIYDLAPEPYGAFAESAPMTDRGDVRVVPTPGHSPAHVSPVFESDGMRILFAGDHMVRQDWITPEGIRVSPALHVYKAQARDTNERLLAFVREFPTVVVPSHDSDAARTLAAREPLRV